jgi:hypothetical protein
VTGYYYFNPSLCYESHSYGVILLLNKSNRKAVGGRPVVVPSAAGSRYGGSEEET